MKQLLYVGTLCLVACLNSTLLAMVKQLPKPQPQQQPHVEIPLVPVNHQQPNQQEITLPELSKKADNIDTRVRGIGRRVTKLEEQMRELIDDAAQDQSRKKQVPVTEEQGAQMACQYNLGKFAYDAKEYAKARDHFKNVIGESKVAEKEVQKESAYLLGTIFLLGLGGVEKDIISACTYYEMAQKHDAHLWKNVRLGYQAFLNEDYVLAVSYFDSLLGQNTNNWVTLWAQVRKAICQVKIKGQDEAQENDRYEKARKSLIAVSNQERNAEGTVTNPEAQALAWAYLGMMYLEGKGGDQNTVIALEYLRQAEDQKESKVARVIAQTTLGTMHREGTGVRSNATQARKYYHAAIDQPELPWYKKCTVM